MSKPEDEKGGTLESRLEKLVQIGVVHGNVILEGNVFLSEAGTRAPHQLRAVAANFVGRRRECELLTTALLRADASTVVVVRGMPGVGKTELAYAVAQEVRSNFPGGQIQLNLLGRGAEPMTPVQVLRGALAALERVPTQECDLEALRREYCDALGDRRVLVFADDAIDLDQIAGLLPPPGSSLIVTSRSRFVPPGAVVVDLECLPSEQSEELIRSISAKAAKRAHELAELCAHLPLALRIAAGVLANDDTVSLEDYLSKLKAARLEYLRDPDAQREDISASVDAAISTSYTALAATDREVLRNCGVFQAPFLLEAAACVSNRTVEDSQMALGLLRRRSLIEYDDVRGRYGLHDLVREYCAARVRADQAVHSRFCAYYTRLLMSLWQGSERGGAGAVKAFHFLIEEKRNIEAVHAWMTKSADAELNWCVCVFVMSLTTAGSARHVFTEDETRGELLATGLAAARSLKQPEVTIVLLNALGHLHSGREQTHALARGCFEEALQLLHDLDPNNALGLIVDPKMYAVDILVAKWDLRDQSDPTKAAEYEQALELISSSFDHSRASTLAEKLAKKLWDAKRFLEAGQAVERGLEVACASRNPERINRFKWILGRMLDESDRPNDALPLVREAVDYLKSIRAPANHTSYLHSLGVRAHERLAEARRSAAEASLPSDLRDFPGCPILTYMFKKRLVSALPHATLFLREDHESYSAHLQDITAYDVFVDWERIGSFTVRHHGQNIVRNLYVHTSNESSIPAEAILRGDNGGSVRSASTDLLGARLERLIVVYYRITELFKRSGLKNVLLLDSGVPPVFPTGGWISMLGMFMRACQDKSLKYGLETQTCDICAKSFALPIGSITLHLIGDQEAATYIVDVGAYCYHCDKYTCDEHVRGTKVADNDPRTMNTTLPFHKFELRCVLCGSAVHFHTRETIRARLEAIERLAAAIARAAGNRDKGSSKPGTSAVQ